MVLKHRANANPLKKHLICLKGFSVKNDYFGMV